MKSPLKKRWDCTRPGYRTDRGIHCALYQTGCRGGLPSTCNVLSRGCALGIASLTCSEFCSLCVYKFVMCVPESPLPRVPHVASMKIPRQAVNVSKGCWWGHRSGGPRRNGCVIHPQAHSPLTARVTCPLTCHTQCVSLRP